VATDRLLFDILARDRASKVFDKVSKSAERSNSAFGKLGKGIGSAAAVAGKTLLGLTVAAGAGITIFAKGAIAEAREAETVTKTTAAIIKATGGAAQVSAAQVANLTTKLSAQSGIDDEVIQKGANLILTFRNIRNEAGKGNDIFDRATAAAVDLSKAGFGSIDSASKQLGKALNDPVKGLTALNRAGVTFTAEQKKRIKGLVEEGDILSAQRIILREVERQVGGVAAASATAGDKARVAFQNFQEAVGQALLPLLDKILTGFADALPKILDFAKVVGNQLKPAFVAVTDAVSALFEGFSAGSKDGEKTLQTLKTILAQVQAALVAALPILVQVGKTIFTVFKQIVTVLGPIIAQISGALVEAFAQAAPQITSAMKSIREIVVNVLEIIRLAWQQFGPFIVVAVKNAFTTIIGVVSGLLKALSGVIKLVLAIIRGDWSGAWKALKQIAAGVMQAVRALVTGFVRSLQNTLRAGLSLLKAIFGKAWNSAKKATADAIKSLLKSIRQLPSKIRGALGKLGRILYNAGRGIINGLINGINSRVQALRDRAGAIARSIKNFFGGSLPTEGPLRGRALEIAGAGLAAQIAKGLGKKISTVSAQAGKVAGAVGPSTLVRPTGGGAPQQVTVVLDVRGGDDEFVKLIRKWIRTRNLLQTGARNVNTVSA
jgi:hypothetical protein